MRRRPLAWASMAKERLKSPRARLFVALDLPSELRDGVVAWGRRELRDPALRVDRDRYQIITEHKRGQIIAEDTGLGFERTDDIVIVQIFQQGRTLHHKRAAYKALAERLQGETGLKPSDLIVTVVENSREDWSFGDGIAQFVEGRLT